MAATVSIATVKSRVKAIFDNTGSFGSVYTTERRRVEDPTKPYVMMWHDGGNQDFEAGDDLRRRVRLLIRIFVPELPGPDGEVDMQENTDTAVEAALEALQADPRLRAGGSPLVIDSIVRSWDITYDPEGNRNRAELTFEASWLEE